MQFRRKQRRSRGVGISARAEAITETLVWRLFNSSGTRPVDAHALNYFVRRREILLHRGRVVRPEKPVLLQTHGRESEEHAYLKWVAFWWLRSLGDDRTETEVPLNGSRAVPGARADVLAPTLGWVVECGDSAPGYVITALRAGFSRFVLFPFVKPGGTTLPYVYFTLGAEGALPLWHYTTAFALDLLRRAPPQVPGRRKIGLGW